MKEIMTHKPELRYRLLSRMVSDCRYYLGYGRRCRKYLWGQDETEHIRYMFMLYDSFPDREKPEWLSRADIIAFGRQMGTDIMDITKYYYKKRRQEAAA